ncbi:unnamed protein product [Thlaspi arvense]|uniref:Insecticidal crystal toxin domain-containing protein n=1 Tax=Thlaspi arvense TaxID=13288 RepID=A0AAU9REI8_THLAR|nr:unnamed protein product [Thlaspi arvense]
MYVTRRLSELQKNPSEQEQLPPEGQNSGVMVIQDEESQPTCCFGSCYDGRLKGLPFPQNVKLTVTYSSGGENNSTESTPVVFIPVLDQPLSSNRYYVIQRRGKHTGKASASAKEEERVSSCFCFTYVPEAKPQQADPYDIYQQFEIQPRSSSLFYSATSVATNGVPPYYLKRKGWSVGYSTSQDFGLKDDAKGVNTKLRLDSDSELACVGKSVVVGKWYVPFIFVMEGNVKDQMKMSTFYSMTLQQRWEEVYFCESVDSEHFEVVVDVEVETEVVKLDGQVTNCRETSNDGVVWFSVLRDERPDKKIGLGSVVVERMKWEEEKFGWLSRGERSNVKRSERFEGGSSHWKSYRCYVFVESFELKRMDGSLVLTYEFLHVDKLKSKWD